MSILDGADWLQALFIKSNGDDKWIEVYAVKNDGDTTGIQIDVCEEGEIGGIRLTVADARKMAAYILDGTREAQQ